MRYKKNIIDHIDWWLVIMYVALMLIGWISIYAALYQEGSSIFNFSEKYGRQFIWMVVAVFIAIIILLFNWKFFEGFAYILYFISILSLIGVLIFGIEVNGAKSWFDFGFFRIQPAEFAKCATALAVAKYLSKLNINIEKMSTKLIVSSIVIAPVLFVIFQNDTGSALVYGSFIIVFYRFGFPANLLIISVIAVLLFISSILISKLILSIIITVIGLLFFLVSKKKLKEIFISLSLVAISIGFVSSVDYVFEKVLEPHQVTRIKILLGQESDPHGAGYNVNQSMIAIGSGGFNGKGFLKGTQTKFNFVPEQSTDFIFCTIGEEWGFLGSLFVLALYLAFIIRIIYITERQRSVFSKIYGYGVASIFFFHIAVNIAMTIGLAPVIGIPLPFISYGGSSLWSFTILLFIFINLDSYRLQILR